MNQDDVSNYNGNTICRLDNSQPGAGGYASGIFTTKMRVPLYILTGGKGEYGEGYKKGGFNGGGACSTESRSGSGGGATDFRLFVNSLFARILVAGGGGGSDDYYNPNSGYGGADDDSGGSGGFVGQAMWKDWTYQ